MSKRANPAVMGAFVVIAVALGVGLVVVLGGGWFFKEVDRYVLFFEGSVKGLKVGSPVMFRGVQIGSVSGVSMKVNPEDLRVLIPVFIDVERANVGILGGSTNGSDVQQDVDRFVAKGMRARLELQSLLTGQLAIQFDFHPGTEVNLVGIDMGVRELPTIPTPLQQMTDTLESLDLNGMAEEITRSMRDFGAFVRSPEMAEGLRSLPAILSEVKGLVRDLRRDLAPVLAGADVTLRKTGILVDHLDQRTAVLGDELEKAVADSRGLVRHVDARVDPLAGRADVAMDESILLLRSAQGSLQRLDAALARADVAAGKLDGELAAGPQLRYELSETLRDISDAARSIRGLADLLRQQPDSLLRGRAPRERK